MTVPAVTALLHSTVAPAGVAGIVVGQPEVQRLERADDDSVSEGWRISEDLKATNKNVPNMNRLKLFLSCFQLIKYSVSFSNWLIPLFLDTPNLDLLAAQATVKEGSSTVPPLWRKTRQSPESW